MVTADEILAALRAEFDLHARRPTSAARPRPSGGSSTAARPAVGVIASVTRPFCGACDRTRLTADGQIRTCLFARTETDLRALLRGGGVGRGDRRHAGGRRCGASSPGHGIDEPGFLQPDRPMSAIGG